MFYVPPTFDTASIVVAVFLVICASFNMYVAFLNGKVLRAVLEERRYREQHAHLLASALLEEKAE